MVQDVMELMKGSKTNKDEGYYNSYNNDDDDGSGAGVQNVEKNKEISLRPRSNNSNGENRGSVVFTKRPSTVPPEVSSLSLKKNAGRGSTGGSAEPLSGSSADALVAPAIPRRAATVAGGPYLRPSYGGADYYEDSSDWSDSTFVGNGRTASYDIPSYYKESSSELEKQEISFQKGKPSGDQYHNLPLHDHHNQNYKEGMFESDIGGGEYGHRVDINESYDGSYDYHQQPAGAPVNEIGDRFKEKLQQEYVEKKYQIAATQHDQDEIEAALSEANKMITELISAQVTMEKDINKAALRQEEEDNRFSGEILVNEVYGVNSQAAAGGGGGQMMMMADTQMIQFQGNNPTMDLVNEQRKQRVLENIRVLEDVLEQLKMAQQNLEQIEICVKNMFESVDIMESTTEKTIELDKKQQEDIQETGKLKKAEQKCKLIYFHMAI
ncbi:hypothetical protein H4219_003505 [Mycoemilia scoparia]|uniref:Uncharacterized protein n=1 Tax=Mycoemilia scoparia TaxID=417184 RepID=A0A9W7ZVD6_9FUNG|nr:hypothetical protein H4219_003505 [Mycoemilia scoparia]